MFFSFYLTKKLNLRGSKGKMYKAFDELTLWIVWPFAFHEWVAPSSEGGIVHDLTPLHPPHVQEN